MTNSRVCLSVALSVLILAVSLGGCRGKTTTLFPGFLPNAGRLDSEFSILSWNIHKSQNPGLGKGLGELLNRFDPDFVLLQEVKSNFTLYAGFGGYFAEGWSYPWPKGTAIGVLTLSKIAPLGYRRLPTKYRELGVLAPKVSLATTYQFPDGDKLLVVNIHLMNFEKTNLRNFQNQLNEIEQLIADHSGPIILAGDCNTWSTDRLQRITRLGAKHQMEEVTRFGPGRTTGDAGSGLLNDLLEVNRSLPLDRVWTRGLNVVSADVLSENLSDHRPILVKFSRR